MGCGLGSARFSKCRKWFLFYHFEVSEVVEVESVGNALSRDLSPFFIP